ncbi:MAG: DUF489 family protein [Gammaproteobacteria bacterium]
MAPTTQHDQIIALAGLFQAAGLVRDIAHNGRYSSAAYETCITSLFQIDADSSEEVYGGLQQLRPGLRLLIDQLRQPSDMETTRYVLSLLALEHQTESPAGYAANAASGHRTGTAAHAAFRHGAP